jgi:hypothetical protein
MSARLSDENSGVEVKHSEYYCRAVNDAAELMLAAGGIMAIASSCCAVHDNELLAAPGRGLWCSQAGRQIEEQNRPKDWCCPGDWPEIPGVYLTCEDGRVLPVPLPAQLCCVHALRRATPSTVGLVVGPTWRWRVEKAVVLGLVA